MQLVLVKLKARSKKAPEVQKVLTQHGCDITLRLGLHEVTDATCAEEGLIILQVRPDRDAVNSLTADLQAVGDVDVKAVSL